MGTYSITGGILLLIDVHLLDSIGSYIINEIRPSGARLELSVLDKQDLYKGPDLACGNHLICSAPLQPTSQDFLWYEFLMHVHWMKCNSYSFNETIAPIGACPDKPDSKKGAFTELWIRRVLPFTAIPIVPFSYCQKRYSLQR
jgi:hypothetical protein